MKACGYEARGRHCFTVPPLEERWGTTVRYQWRPTEVSGLCLASLLQDHRLHRPRTLTAMPVKHSIVEPLEMAGCTRPCAVLSWVHLVSHVHIEICVLTAVPVHTFRRLQTGLPVSLQCCPAAGPSMYLLVPPSYLPSYTAAALASSRHILIPVFLGVPCLGPTVSHWFTAHCRSVSFCSFTSLVWRRLLLFTADGGWDCLPCGSRSPEAEGAFRFDHTILWLTPIRYCSNSFQIRIMVYKSQTCL